MPEISKDGKLLSFFNEILKGRRIPFFLLFSGYISSVREQTGHECNKVEDRVINTAGKICSFAFQEGLRKAENCHWNQKERKANLSGNRVSFDGRRRREATGRFWWHQE